MATSQNGYSAITTQSGTFRWDLPLKKGSKKYLFLRPGPTGFILSHFALFHHERVEPLNTQDVWDDWGWAYRPIRGTTTTLSNHSSGTAMDLNATVHPYRAKGTYNAVQVKRIKKRLKWLRGVIRWGGDYRTVTDEMHYEIFVPALVLPVARMLQRTPRGRRIMKANPGYKKV